MDEWNADKILSTLFEPPKTDKSDSAIEKIKKELGAAIHSAIEMRVEEAIVSENPLWGRPLIGYRTEELEKMSDEPEVSRKCPFCGTSEIEHYDLARHIAKEHPKESIKRYKEDIEFLFRHPEEAGERHSIVTNIFTDSDVESGTNFCPFCEKPLAWNDIKPHVSRKHGNFMNVFYDVIKGD